MKILVPVDGSKSSNKSVEVAKEIGKKFEAELLIMTVVSETSIFEQYPTNFPYTLEVNKANTERAEYVLKEVEESLKGYPYKVELFHTVGSPAEEIVNVAEDRGCSLIIVGNRGLGAFSRTLLGSVSNKVINASKISVLVVKSDIK
ncbi:universal stress protein [Peptoniphilus sp.]|uniref:universal stress protein n=1 Tax=Peptoniphilus sp. TaxID=1971214 RepID=UPI00399533E2